MDTVLDMLNKGILNKCLTVDACIGLYLKKFVKDEEKFLSELYDLGLHTEAEGNISPQVAKAKYFK